MISAMGSGMPQMDAMRQLQQATFRNSDANGSGGLDAAEFASMVRDSPQGQTGGPGQIDTDAVFAKVDADGSGQLSEAELTRAHEQLMSRFQSTMQAFGSESGAGAASPRGTQTSLDALLQAMGNEEDGDEAIGRATAVTDDLLAQLRALVDRVSSTYAPTGREATGGLQLSA